MFTCGRAIMFAAATIASMSIGHAQPSSVKNYTSIEAARDVPVQIGYFASAHKDCTKDCTPARVPTIRVAEPPRSGTLTIREAELTTGRIAGCLALKVPAKVLFYQARMGSLDTDHIVYEVTSSNGEVAEYQVTINIREGPKAAPAPIQEHKT
jgi:hypothetical protein